MAMRVSKRGRARPQPFSLFGQGTPKTQKQFNTMVNQQAQQGYQPQLQDVKRQQQEEAATHNTRMADLGKWSDWYGGTLKSSYDDATKAINDLIAQRTGSSNAAQAALGSALRGDTANQDAMASMLGAAPVAGPDAGKTLGAAYGTSEGGANELSTVGGAGLLAAANREALAPLQAAAGYRAENERDFGVTGPLAKQRSDILAQVPSMRQAARNDLFKQFLAGQAESSQESLGRGQLRLGKTTEAHQHGIAQGQLQLAGQTEARQTAAEKFNEYMQQSQLDLDTQKFAHQKAIDWKTLAQNGGQLQGKAWQGGVDTMAGFLKPTPAETKSNTNKHPTAYKRNPMDLFRLLVGQNQLDRTTALTLMYAAQDPGIRKWALQRLPGLKKSNEQLPHTARPHGQRPT